MNDCSPICDQFEVFNLENNTCDKFYGDSGLFTQRGRLSYDWSYKTYGN